MYKQEPAARSMNQSRTWNSSGDKMNRKQVRKAIQAVDAASEAYEKAAKDLLAAVEATPAEIEAATEIIFNDLVVDVGQFVCGSLSYDEQVAYVILDDLREEQLQ
jgi:hypothetical protein